MDIPIFIRESTFKKLKNSETSSQINNNIIHRSAHNPKILRQNDNHKVHKNINNPRIFILALIYLNPKITHNIIHKNLGDLLIGKVY